MAVAACHDERVSRQSESTLSKERRLSVSRVLSGRNLIPTFQYRTGTILIEDRLMAIGGDERPSLQRVLRFESPSPQTVWFRVLVGDIVRESDRLYRTGQLQLTIPAADAKLRPLSGDQKQSELLLQLQIPQGQSSLEFRYEPRSK